MQVANSALTPRFLERVGAVTSRKRMAGFAGLAGFSGIQDFDWVGIESRIHARMSTADNSDHPVNFFAMRYREVQGMLNRVDQYRGQPEAGGLIQAADGQANSVYQQAYRLAVASEYDQYAVYAGKIMYTDARREESRRACWEGIDAAEAFLRNIGPMIDQTQGAINARIARENDARNQAIAAQAAESDRLARVAAAAAAAAMTIQRQAEVVTTQVTETLVDAQADLKSAVKYINSAKVLGVPVMPLIVGAVVLGGGIFVFNKYGKRLRNLGKKKEGALAGYRSRRARKSRR